MKAVETSGRARRSVVAAGQLGTRWLRIAVLLGGLMLSGCELMGWLEPHQWWKLNREPPLGGRDAMFSVPAELTTEVGPSDDGDQ